MRIKHSVLLTISEDTEYKDILFERDAQREQVVIDSYERQVSGLISIAASQSETLSFGDITNVKGLYLRVDQDATIKLNGSDDSISLVKGGSYAKFFMEATITEVEITCPVSVTLTGVYCAWGDAAA